MKCAQVIEFLSDLESLSNGQANLFCTITQGDLNGFGSPAVMTTKGQFRSFSHVKDTGMSIGNG